MIVNFLELFSEEQVRIAVLNGITKIRSERSIFSYSWICAQLASVLFLPADRERYEVAKKNWVFFEQYPGINETSFEVENHDSLKIMSVLWRMVNDGVFFPRYNRDSPTAFAPVSFCLTIAGKRLIDNLPEHPHGPGFADAFRRSAAKRDPDVIACFDNAVECFRRGIFRASMMLMGVAAEITARAAYEALARKGVVASRLPRAAQETIIRLKAATTGQTHEDKEIQAALVALDLVRGKRNLAVHPEREEFSSTVIEQMLGFSANAIPTIWALVIEPEIVNGFVWPPQ